MRHMKTRLKARCIMGALAGLQIAPWGAAMARAESATRTVASSQPPYFARLEGDSLKSITLSPELLRLDMHAENAIASETGAFKPARYSFPDATVPKSVLHDLSGIYRYDRRRDVPIVSSGGDWVVAEYFLAGSHIPVSRFRMLGKQVQRQERLNRAGKTTRIIAVGWARPSTEEEDDTTNLSELGDRPAWIRVFDVSSGGKKTLAALAWRRQRFAVAPGTYDVPDEQSLLFGLPDGTVKWHTRTAFLKALDIDLDARSLTGEKRGMPS